MSVNKVILIGNLGKDPEVKYTQQQVAVCRLVIATNERRKDASGTWSDHTEWHNVTAFGKTGENCGKFLKKGRQVYVEGRLQTRKWQDKEGKDRYSTDIVADTVQFLSTGAGGGRGAENSSYESSAPSSSQDEMAAGRDLVNSLPTAEAMTSAAEKVPFDDADIPF